MEEKCKICGKKAIGNNYIEITKSHKYARLCNRCFEKYEFTKIDTIKQLIKQQQKI